MALINQERFDKQQQQEKSRDKLDFNGHYLKIKSTVTNAT
jgi:hypothetical protein